MSLTTFCGRIQAMVDPSMQVLKVVAVTKKCSHSDYVILSQSLYVSVNNKVMENQIPKIKCMKSVRGTLYFP